MIFFKRSIIFCGPSIIKEKKQRVIHPVTAANENNENQDCIIKNFLTYETKLIIMTEHNTDLTTVG